MKQTRDELSFYDQCLILDDIKNHNGYVRAVERVLRSYEISFAELIDNIQFYIYSYEFGDKKEENYSHGTVSAALKKVKKYYIDKDFIFFIKIPNDGRLTLEEFLYIKDELNSWATEALSFERKKEIIEIQEIKPGCIEVLFKIVEYALVVVPIILKLLDTHFLNRKILRGSFDKIDKLSFAQIIVLLSFLKLLLHIMNRRGEDFVVLGLWRNKFTLTRETILKIIELLEK